MPRPDADATRDADTSVEAGAAGDADGAEALHRAAEALYAEDPAQFITARTSAVADARRLGHREAARTIGTLRKPNLPAWAINQVVRQSPAVVGELRDLGAQLRHATATMDAPTLTALRGRREEALAAIADQSAQIASTRGHRLSEAALSEVRATAVAALADASAEEVAYSGTLTRTLTYSGFGEVDLVDAVARTATGVPLAVLRGSGADGPPQDAEGEPSPPDGGHPPSADTTSERTRAQQHARRIAAAQEQLQAAEREQRIAEQRSTRAHTRFDTTQRRVADLRADLEEAIAETTRAQQELDRAAAQLDTAHRRHQEAVAQLEQLGDTTTSP